MLPLIGGSPMTYRRVKASVFIDRVQKTGLDVSYHPPHGFRAGCYEVSVSASHRGWWNFLHRLQPALSFAAYDQLLRSIWVAHTRSSALCVRYGSGSG